MAKKYVYFFGEGDGSMKPLLGGKGAGLAEMTRIGLPVPPGFTITTEVCNEFYELGQKYPEGLRAQVEENLKRLEEKRNKKLGDLNDPLLVSVRSGAPISMPGMMDTVLNLGLNDVSVQGFIKQTDDARFGFDSYRRFIQMFGNVVKGIAHEKFEEVLDEVKEEVGAKVDTDLDADALQEVIKRYKELYKTVLGEEFPQEPQEQLWMAIDAVFNSWNNERAITYRKYNKIPDNLGTAVNVQSMVFGNTGFDSGTGVGFTRNPSTGEKKLYGEYLLNAQGEDVVAGIRTPHPIAQMSQELPEVYKQLAEVAQTLEKHYRDMQDFEFTIERKKLYMLQTRTGKRTAQAAVKVAVDMESEGLITKEEALMRVGPEQLDQLLHRRIDPNAKKEVVTKGLPASPGAASGEVVFDADEAKEFATQGKKTLLVRPETTPDDIHGIIAAEGVLTSRGGMTSHAAVVARGMGKPCVAGAGEMYIDLDMKVFKIGDIEVKEGDTITIDGATGEVILGEVPMIEPELSGEFLTILKWADDVRTLGIRANADTPEDAKKAREFGAEGIGLCRTEHMFMAQDRLPIVQDMILAEDKEERKKALDKILPMQKGDFVGILKAMEGLPVIIRLLDPPLHEFLPSLEELLVEVTELKIKGNDPDKLKEKEELLKRVRELHEFNPMLGLRGCRLGLLYPEIYEMQVKAIFEAAVELKKQGIDVKPEVMIPLVGNITELKPLREMSVKIADEIIAKSGTELKYMVGTMIELPRAALTADEIAKEAEFFSYGTNDLTQTTLGISRDDAEGKFLGKYEDMKIIKDDPFQVLDRDGVGKLIDMGTKLGKKTRPELEVGICGEHGGDPSSIEFCHITGLNYVSCSPFRVPIARLAAAQAKIKNG